MQNKTKSNDSKFISVQKGVNRVQKRGKKKRDSKSKTGEAPTWRSIEQKTAVKRVSAPAKKRHLMRTLKDLGIALGMVILVIMSYCLYGLWNAHHLPFPSVKIMPYIESIQFESNGVLTLNWFQKAIGVEKDLTLMEVDILKVKQQLESYSQIRLAIVERFFPSTLKIEIKEYAPILKVIVKNESGEYKTHCISREGVVFESEGYSQSFLKTLSYFEKVDLVRDGKGFKVLNNIDCVADLIDYAKMGKPHLCQDWKSIWIERFENGDDGQIIFIHIRSNAWGEIVFKGKDFVEQLDRLDYILSYLSEQKVESIKKIDLSLDDTAAVQLKSRESHKVSKMRRT